MWCSLLVYNKVPIPPVNLLKVCTLKCKQFEKGTKTPPSQQVLTCKNLLKHTASIIAPLVCVCVCVNECMTLLCFAYCAHLTTQTHPLLQ